MGPSSGSAGDAQSFPTRLGVYVNQALPSFLVVLLNSFGLVNPLAQRASLDIDGLDLRTSQPVELDESVAAH